MYSSVRVNDFPKEETLDKTIRSNLKIRIQSEYLGIHRGPGE